MYKLASWVNQKQKSSCYSCNFNNNVSYKLKSDVYDNDAYCGKYNRLKIKDSLLLLLSWPNGKSSSKTTSTHTNVGLAFSAYTGTQSIFPPSTWLDFFDVHTATPSPLIYLPSFVWFIKHNLTRFILPACRYWCQVLYVQ